MVVVVVVVVWWFWGGVVAVVVVVVAVVAISIQTTIRRSESNRGRPGYAPDQQTIHAPSHSDPPADTFYSALNGFLTTTTTTTATSPTMCVCVVCFVCV